MEDFKSEDFYPVLVGDCKCTLCDGSVAAKPYMYVDDVPWFYDDTGAQCVECGFEGRVVVDGPELVWVSFPTIRIDHREHILISDPCLLKALQLANRQRTKDAFNIPVKDWAASQYGNALAGEVGELCNLIKKLERDGPRVAQGEAYPMSDEQRKALADEASDVLTYLDLLCQRLGFDLGDALAHKWNEVSQRRGYFVRIGRQ